MAKKPRPKPKPKPELLEAFSELKQRLEWPDDERCVVKRKVFWKRLKMGWPPEAAMCIASDLTMTRMDAFGERKNVTGWLADSRCKVRASTLLRRLRNGVPLEAALTQPVPGLVPEVFTAGILKHKKYKRTFTHIQKHEAFGKKKTLAVWAEDPRCKVDEALLGRRLREGVPLEAAMIFESNESGIVRKHFWAFGERKRLFEWLLDPRMKVSAIVLRERLLNGETMEHAMSRSENRRPTRKSIEEKKLLTLFGITQTAWFWVLDPRCEVSFTTLRHRMASGWPRNKSILKLAKDAENTEPGQRVLHQFEAFNHEGKSIGRFRNLEQATEAIRASSGKGTVVWLFVHKTWTVTSPPRQTLIVGKLYTRPQIHKIIGGGALDLLPSSKNRILAGCFIPETCPEAPERVAVGQQPILLRRAQRAAKMNVELPVFVREKEGNWKYHGRYKVVRYDESIEERERYAVVVHRAAIERLFRARHHLRWADQVEEVLALYKEGLNSARISEKLSIPKTTVCRYIKKAKLDEFLEEKFGYLSAGEKPEEQKEPISQEDVQKRLEQIGAVLTLTRVGD